MKESYGPIFRLWHWLTVVAMGGLLVTVALRESVLDKKEVARIIADKLAEFGVSLASDQVIAVAKAVRANMWAWHYIFAALLTLAIVVRIVAMIKGEATLPILKVLRAEGAAEKGKAAVHLLICMGIALMTLSGWFYYFHEALGFEKAAVHWVKELHEALWVPLTLLVFAHIAGVVRHELATKEPIVSHMIHGKNDR
ncbi:MAG: cytochrome b/b6 domain-containing protein [Epsilonproteobacteria bacterium]|nr:cytochrome b/b6 domain-containing protein [Campylobacterota bacterium]